MPQASPGDARSVHQHARSLSGGWRWLAMLVMLLAAPAGLAGCQEQIKVSDKDLLQIQYRELADMMARSQENKRHGIVLLDARKAKDYDDGHIPGAINIFLPDIVAGDDRLSRARTIVVYSAGWSDPISRAAGKRLMALGYKNVVDFRGGVEAWRAEGRLLKVNRTPQTQPDTSPATPTP